MARRLSKLSERRRATVHRLNKNRSPIPAKDRALPDLHQVSISLHIYSVLLIIFLE